jgi:hypothetical protein
MQIHPRKHLDAGILLKQLFDHPWEDTVDEKSYASLEALRSMTRAHRPGARGLSQDSPRLFHCSPSATDVGVTGPIYAIPTVDICKER